MKTRRLHLAVIGAFIFSALLCFVTSPAMGATPRTPAADATSTPAGGVTGALAVPAARITGKIIEAGSGLPLPGVRVVADGPTMTATITDSNGNFTFENLIAGSYSLVATLKGFETTATDQFPLVKGQTQDLTIAIQRTRGNTAGVRVLGRLQIHGSSALQTAAVISSTVAAQSMAKQGIYRAGDQLIQLPAISNGGSSGATAGDAITVDIRGIGELETITMIDGNPIGPGFGGAYSFQLSPVFGLQDIKVLYGSGSDLYGVDAIGGVVDMQTLNPTLHPTATFSQGYGTWNNLSTSVTATGSTTGGKFGYAAAFGSQGQVGYFKHDNMYQASAAFDPYAVDPAVRALGVYPDDTSLTNKSTLLKGRLNFSDTSHLTAAWLSGAWWDDKTGNGDNDYLPYEVALHSGQNQLAAAAGSGGADTCYNANPATFTAGTNTNGSAPGTGPGGVSDIPGHPAGAPLCITPQQFAQSNDGWQGAGTAWNALRSNAYSVRYEQTHGNNTFSLNTFTNIYRDSVDRTHQLPFFVVPSDNPSWSIEQATNSGLTASDDILTKNNEFGFGYFWENSAYYFLTGMPAPIGGQEQPAPITHQTAYFLRDAWHPVNSRLTTYGNVWFKHSTVTNSSFIDPRISFVYTQGNNVLRVAGGRTSTEPRPSQIESVFQPTALGVFNGNVVCSGFNTVGAVPSSELKPEAGVDQEFSYGHRFAGDTTLQLTLYNENIFQQIYDSLTLPLSALTVPFDPTAYANAVSKGCGVTQAQALGLLGVSGSINIGHTLARGIDLSGRVRLSAPFFIDYTYDTMSTALKSTDPSLINPAFNGNLTLIPNSQLPSIPLHKWSFTLDYTFWRDIDAQFETYHESENNQRNLPAYTSSNLSIGVPVGAGTFTTTVNNLWQTYADYRGLIGEGYPLALNSFAQPSDYQPFLGAQATERFGLPLRTIQFNYSIKVK